MFDNDNDFSIENILKAAQSGQADGKKLKADKIRPIAASNEHKAPHALTPEEVLHFAEPQKADKPLPDFDAISKSLNFVVFENDIDPDKTETPQISFGNQVTPETNEESAPITLDLPKTKTNPEPGAKPAFFAEPPAPEKSITPSTPDDAPVSAPQGGTLYERMKQMHAAQKRSGERVSTPVPQIFSAPTTVEPPAPISKAQAVAPTAPTKPDVTKLAADQKVNDRPVLDKPVAIPTAPTDSKAAKPSKPIADEIKMTPTRPAARRGSASLSVEEIIRSAEKLAANKVQDMYGTPTIRVSGADAAFTAPSAPKQDSTASSASDSSERKADSTDVKPESTPDPEPTPAPTIKNDSKTNEASSNGTRPRTGVKVSTLKRSRVFRTPTGGGVTTPATKVVSGEIPVEIKVIDQSLNEPAADDRIKEHNPYASQYSLADADLPDKGQLFATQSIDKLSDLFDGEKEITSSIGGATDKTIQFDPAKPLDEEPIEIKVDTQEKREAWEDDLEASRRNKARAFKLFGAVPLEEEPLNMPTEPSAQIESEPDEPELTDYETIADAQSILSHLNGKLGKVLVRLLGTLLITILLFIGALPISDALRAQNNLLFCLFNLLLLILAAVINLPTMKGLVSLFALRPDTDSPAALAVCGALIQTLYVSIAGTSGALLTALGGLALSFNLLGKLTMLSTVKGNFRMIADEDEKKSVVLLEDTRVTSQLAGGSVLGEAFIIAGRKVKNATGFLFNSFTPDPYEKPLGKIMLLTILAAIGGAVIGILNGNLDLCFTLFAAVLLLGCPITSALLGNLPMKFANKRLNRLGAELTAFAPAREMSYANAIALEAGDLFPTGTVKLYNMHILAPNPVDRSILEAAAVATRAGSPIAPIFTEMNHEGLPLPEVDTVHFEDKMGLSGWIGDKRIFIGNRTLMTAHNISGLPSLDIDKRILKSGYFPVYLATTEGPCALFILGYEADEEISAQLRRLTHEGVTLLIDSCDQNVSEEMIYDYFDLHDDSIRMLSPQTAKLYEEQVTPMESEPSFAVCKSDAAGLAAILSASIRLNRAYTASLVLHILFLFAGCAMVLATGYAGTGAWITALGLGIYQLVTGLVTLAISVFYRP